MRWFLGLAVCAGALVLGGCGGGSDSASTASTTTQVTTASTPQSSEHNTQAEPQAGEKGKQDKGKSNGSTAKEGNEGNGSSSKRHPKLVKVPPISSAPVAGSRAPAPGVKTVKGVDNSVQEYGVEADSSSRRQAAIALQAFLNARAEEDWATACAYLAKRPLEQLERLQEAAAKQGKKLDGCVATLALLKEGEGRLRAQATITEVLSFRGEGDVSGDPSYLIFTAPPTNTLYSMPMYLEGGAWKVGLARPAELATG
jgi:hypothetical protein